MTKDFNTKGAQSTQVLRVDPFHPDAAVIERAAAILRAGGLVAVPTETVYGLAADARQDIALGRIFDAKGRPADNPLIVHVADAAGAQAVTREWPETARRLAARFWPGPLTLILPRHASIPSRVSAGLDTVAVRAPAHPVMQALIRAVGPLAAPSANRSMSISPTSAVHVLSGLEGRIPMVLDGGSTTVGIESTVLSLVHEPPRILRPGSVSLEEIEEVLGEVEAPVAANTATATAAGPRQSPGTSARHYAPEAQVIVVPRGDAKALTEALVGATRGERFGALLHTLAATSAPAIEALVLPDDPRRYAAGLYAALHALDACCERIVIEAVPETESWMAVRDRLRRASA